MDRDTEAEFIQTDARARANSGPASITVANPGAAHLSGHSLETFEECVRRYSEELWREVGRLESAHRTTAGEPEITSTMVQVADVFLRQRPRRKSAPIIAGYVVTGVATLLCGVAVNHLDRGAGQVGFALSFAVAVLAGVLTFLRE